MDKRKRDNSGLILAVVVGGGAVLLWLAWNASTTQQEALRDAIATLVGKSVAVLPNSTAVDYPDVDGYDIDKEPGEDNGYGPNVGR